MISFERHIASNDILPLSVKSGPAKTGVPEFEGGRSSRHLGATYSFAGRDAKSFGCVQCRSIEDQTSRHPFVLIVFECRTT